MTVSVCVSGQARCVAQLPREMWFCEGVHCELEIVGGAVGCK